MTSNTVPQKDLTSTSNAGLWCYDPMCDAMCDAMWDDANKDAHGFMTASLAFVGLHNPTQMHQFILYFNAMQANASIHADVL